MTNEEQTEIVVIDESTLQSKIHIVRGQKVMLDFELAEIYGYTTKRFNEQIKNNIERFDEDFRFQLTTEEVNYLRCKISTTNISSMNKKTQHFSALRFCLTNL